MKLSKVVSISALSIGLSLSMLRQATAQASAASPAPLVTANPDEARGVAKDIFGTRQGLNGDYTKRAVAVAMGMHGAIAQITRVKMTGGCRVSRD
jgi:hypothetical protein